MLKKLSKIISKSSSIDDNMISKFTSYSSNKLENNFSSLLKSDSQDIINYDQVLGSENIAVNPTEDDGLEISFIDNSLKPLDIQLGEFPIIIRDRFYNFQLDVTGDYVPPLKYKTSGLPSEITLDSITNEFSGTCTSNNMYNVFITVSDSTGADKKFIRSLQVRNLKLAINIPDGTFATDYFGSVSCTDGIYPYNYSIENLPTGLEIDSETGFISGQPFQRGNINLNIKVIDDDNNIIENNMISMYVYLEPIIITTESLPVLFNLNGNYTATISHTGGYSPSIIHTITGLPEGLTYNNNVISGIVNSSAYGNEYDVLVTIEDGYSDPVSKNYILSVPDVLTITSDQTINPGYVSSAYSYTFTATGGTGTYTWVLYGTGTLPAGLTLNYNTGVLSGIPTTFNINKSFQIKVTDQYGIFTIELFYCSVYSALQITTASLPDSYLSNTYSNQLASSGGKTPNTWSIDSGSIPDGLTLTTQNIINGLISGTPTGDVKLYTAVIRVTDDNGTYVTKSFSFNLLNNFVISTETDLNGEINITYSKTFTATGGKTPYSNWALNSGSLPTGLALSAAGVLSGKPTATGTYNFVIKVQDANAKVITKTFRYICYATLVISTTSPLTIGTTGTSYNNYLDATGGVTPYNWSVVGGTLHTGLTLTDYSNRGRISGTPTSTGANTITFRMTDTNGKYINKALVLEINDPLTITTTTATIPEGYVGTTYSFALKASGGKTAYTWALYSGTLPAGLSLSTAGVISGTPTTNTSYWLAFKVTDAASRTATIGSYYFYVRAALTITTTAITAGNVGKSYSFTLSYSGGKSAYTWSVAGGTLPAGLSLSTAGVISGTPTTVISPSITFRLTDGNGVIVNKALTVAIFNREGEIADPGYSAGGGTAGTNSQITNERAVTVVGSAFQSPSLNATYYSAMNSTSYQSLGGSGSDPWRAFYPKNTSTYDSYGWCHTGANGWLMQKFGSLKTLRTVTVRSSANGTGINILKVYALSSTSDTTGYLIAAKQYNYTNTYGTSGAFTCGVNVNVACYGIRVQTYCYTGHGNYSYVSGVTAYCS